MFSHGTEYFYLIYEKGEIVKKYTDPIKTANEINLENQKRINKRIKEKIKIKEKTR